jgi:putative Mg2+ transporter-C (MgtC) family protein
MPPLAISVTDLIGEFEWEPIFRITLATILGAIIGYQREQHGRAAGLRTHMMLSAGSALVMLLSLYTPTLFRDFLSQGGDQVISADPTRIAANVITGLGFLGAGAIIVLGRRVVGLTTATGIWVTAAIGMAVGAGYIIPAVFCHTVAVFALWVVNKWEKKINLKDRQIRLVATFKTPGEYIDPLKALLGRHGFDMVEYTVDVLEGRSVYRLLLSYSLQPDFEKVTGSLATEMTFCPDEVRWEIT